MLSPDLIPVKRRGEELKLAALSAKDRERALELSQEISFALSDLVGRTQEEVELVLAGIECSAREKKLKAGLVKLALDAAHFDAQSELAPVEIRRLVFERAARARAELGEQFDRDALLAEVARGLSVAPQDLEKTLFSDLKGAAELRAAPEWRAEELVSDYIEAQLLSVFLRAVRVRAFLRLQEPSEVRGLFRKLKFRELLFRLEEERPGLYRLELEGPSAMLASSTRAGLRFAQVIRALISAGAHELEADVLWGKTKRPLTFRHTVIEKLSDPNQAEPRSELQELRESEVFEGSGYIARPAERIFHLPGIGVCVPDLEFVRPGEDPTYFELLGEGSREAVFRRADWARQNPEQKWIFAAASRLRVSPEIMDGAGRAQLLVYKGGLSAKKILALLQSSRAAEETRSRGR